MEKGLEGGEEKEGYCTHDMGWFECPNEFTGLSVVSVSGK